MNQKTCVISDTVLDFSLLKLTKFFWRIFLLINLWEEGARHLLLSTVMFNFKSWWQLSFIENKHFLPQKKICMSNDKNDRAWEKHECSIYYKLTLSCLDFLGFIWNQRKDDVFRYLPNHVLNFLKVFCNLKERE